MYKKWTDQEVEKAKELYLNHNKKFLANYFNVTPGQMQWLIVKHKIKKHNDINILCITCNIVKSIDNFDKGRRSCYECRKEYKKNYHKIYYQKQSTKQKRREYYKNNKENILITNKKSREKHKHKYSNMKKEQHRKNPLKNMLLCAKRRAKEKNIEFSININDIIMPEICPVFGIPLLVGDDRSIDNSPSLDRINNTKGYTKDNTIIVSHKANTIKNNASIEDLEKIYHFYKNIGKI